MASRADRPQRARHRGRPRIGARAPRRAARLLLQLRPPGRGQPGLGGRRRRPGVGLAGLGRSGRSSSRRCSPSRRSGLPVAGRIVRNDGRVTVGDAVTADRDYARPALLLGLVSVAAALVLGTNAPSGWPRAEPVGLGHRDARLRGASSSCGAASSSRGRSSSTRPARPVAPAAVAAGRHCCCWPTPVRFALLGGVVAVIAVVSTILRRGPPDHRRLVHRADRLPVRLSRRRSAGGPSRAHAVAAARYPSCQTRAWQRISRRSPAAIGRTSSGSTRSSRPKWAIRNSTIGCPIFARPSATRRDQRLAVRSRPPERSTARR